MDATAGMVGSPHWFFSLGELPLIPFLMHDWLFSATPPEPGKRAKVGLADGAAMGSAHAEKSAATATKDAKRTRLRDVPVFMLTCMVVTRL